jgi:hypothetical protein
LWILSIYELNLTGCPYKEIETWFDEKCFEPRKPDPFHQGSDTAPHAQGVPFTLTSAVLRDEHQPPAHCPVTEHPLLVLLRSSCEMGFLCLSSGFLAHLGEASA